MHSLAFRAMRMFEQQHRLERKLTGGEVAELLAIPALDGLRPSFWGHCVVGTVRSFTHDTAREIGARHLPPLPQGPDRAELVITSPAGSGPGCAIQQTRCRSGTTPT